MNTTLKRLRPPRHVEPERVASELIAQAEPAGWECWNIVETEASGKPGASGKLLRFFKDGEEMKVRYQLEGGQLNLRAWKTPILGAGAASPDWPDLGGPAEYVLAQFGNLFCEHSLLQSVRNSAHAGHLGDTIRLVLEVACRAPDQVPDSWVVEAMPYAKGVGLDLDLMNSIMAHHPDVLFDVAGGRVRKRGHQGFTIHCPDVIYDRIWGGLLELLRPRLPPPQKGLGRGLSPQAARLSSERNLWAWMEEGLPPDLARDLAAQFRAAFVRECLPFLLWRRFETGALS